MNEKRPERQAEGGGVLFSAAGLRGLALKVISLVVMLVALGSSRSAEMLDDCFACIDTSVSSPGPRVTGQYTIIDLPFACTSKVVDLARNFEGDEILLSSADHVWVGGIYAGSSVADARPSEIVVERKPLTVSVSLPGLGTSSVVVPAPSRSAVLGAVNQILATAGTNSVNPARISFNYTRYESREQTALALGVSSASPFWDASAGFGRDRARDELSIFMQVYQPYYTVAADQPASPAGLLGESVVCADVKKQLRAVIDAPVVALSCVFGRAVFYELSASRSALGSAIDADIAVAFQQAVVGGNLSTSQQSLLSKLQVRALVLGGSPGAASGLMTLDGASMLYRDGLYWSHQSPGFPLLYSFHCLRPGFPQFTYSRSTRYVARECNRDKGSGLWKVYWFGWDNGHENTYTLLPDGSPHSPAGLPGAAGSPWASPRIAGEGGGILNLGYPRDYNVYCETFLYVSVATSVPYDVGADAGFIWLNGSQLFGGVGVLPLKQGLNHVIVTSYNQHQGSAISVRTRLQDAVDWMGHEPPGPVLAASRERLDFTVEEGAQGGTVELAVGNTGSGTLEYHVESSVPWLTVVPAGGSIASGSSPVTHSVVVDSSALLAGQREATLRISANASQTGGQALVLPVRVDVAPPSVWLVGDDLLLSEGGLGSFQVHRTGVLAAPLSVQMVLGGLLSGGDFWFIPPTLRFAPGETARTVEFIVADGAGRQGRRDGVAGLVPNPGYTVVPGKDTVGITIVETPPRLWISRNGALITLSWDSDGAVVESTRTLGATPETTSWVVERIVPGGSLTIGSVEGAAKYYRVRRRQ